ncbi:MerR family transcriptional regulator [Paenibacillus pinisoli]|nr:MerR family transcriptional regulator [Paenibacillus pinisoli]
MPVYLRGQIAKMANINMETLRYYEELGLITSPQRSESGYRIYSDDVIAQLTFIQNAKSCGFTLREIKKALTKASSGQITIGDFIHAIEQKTSKIQAEIAKREKTLSILEKLKQDLQIEDKQPEVQMTLRALHMES